MDTTLGFVPGCITHIALLVLLVKALAVIDPNNFGFNTITGQKRGTVFISDVLLMLAHGILEEKALVADLRQSIHQQQTVKHAKTLDEQEAKIKRGAKRNCTKGHSTDYIIHLSAQKQQPILDGSKLNALKNSSSSFNNKVFLKARTLRLAVLVAEIRWHGATDAGLVNTRPSIRLWGMRSEIKLHEELSAIEDYKNKTPTQISKVVLARGSHLQRRKKLYTSVHKIEYDGTL